MKVPCARFGGSPRVAAGFGAVAVFCLLVAIPTGAIDENTPAAPRVRERGGQEARDRAQPGEAAPGAQRLVPQYVPPRQPWYDQRWRLGVAVDHNSRGAVIRRVVPGSAASRSGLEPRDIIVTVAGYQVGQVDGVLYDLGDELQIRAGARGDVRLLVWNHRNGQLVNVDTRLMPLGPVVRDRGRTPRALESETETDGDIR